MKSAHRPTNARRVLLTVAVLLGLLLLNWLQDRDQPGEHVDRLPPVAEHKEDIARPDAAENPAPPAESTTLAEPTTPPADEPVRSGEKRPTQATRSTQIEDVAIRDLDGRVVFRGTVDVQSTLDRIDAGELLDYRNDGSTFQNREGRLPKKPAGYYKEYVHPTPKLSGPGPQRIVVGKQGEAYYTPDHYKTFERVR